MIGEGSLDLFISIILSALVVRSQGTSLTVLNESITAYVIIAFTIPIQNINKPRIAFINGTGRHEEASNE